MPEDSKKRTAIHWPARFCDSGTCRRLRQAPERSGGGQDPKKLVPWQLPPSGCGTQFAVGIAAVGLDCVHREKKPGRDLSIAQSLGDELQYLNFPLAKGFNQFRLGVLGWGEA
jgi:hypothetical protein